MYKKIRLLTVTFTAELSHSEVPAFRGAIINKVGRKNILFHHHKDDNYLYRYPAIQYKSINQKAAIVCIEQGVDEIHKYFEKPDWSLWLGNKKLEMKVEKIILNQFTLQVWNTMFHYKIRNWLALSQENYLKYKNITNENAQKELLERILIGNIIAFAKGVEWDIDKTIQLKINEIIRTKPIKLKDKQVIGFDVDFRTNIFLPNNIGLGKSVSIGHGIVKQQREKNSELKEDTSNNEKTIN